VTYTNTSPEGRLLGLDTEPAYSLFWAPNVSSGDEANMMMRQEIVWREGEENIHFQTGDLERPADGAKSKVMLSPDWVAVKSAFFIVAMKPDFDGARGWALGDPKHFQVALDVPRTEVPAGGADTRAFKVYLGPLQGHSLAAAWPGLNTSLEFFTMFGIMDTFAKGMLWMLNWFYFTIIANYGFAIIFLTIVVRLVMFPLTLKGMKSMKKMQKLAPEMEKIKAEIGDDQQELQKRMMELYRERGVNPLGGCMPMLLQMPVFIALYRVYAAAFEFRGAPFLGWITDLSKPDALFMLPFTIPVPFTANGVNSFNLLPILMGLAMVLSTKLMPTSGPAQNPQQKMIMTLMPVIFSVFCYNMASGLNLYILTSTLLGILQNYFVHVGDEELKAIPRAAAKKKARPKHFYAAAQARKKEAAREERRGKKKGPRGKASGKD
jgi:YidC/Oxa1 family membrane protein insertase